MLNASRTYLAVGGEGVRLGDRGRVGGREAEGGDGGDAKHRERRARGYDDADVLIAFFPHRQRNNNAIDIFFLLRHRFFFRFRC